MDTTTPKVTKTNEDILKILCDSVKNVLSFATKSNIVYSPMVQKVAQTCLKPDIGCFVMFDGGVSGLVVMNFSAESALEIYRNYMVCMGMPENELATLYTSDDVANTLGELMNQIIGSFQVNFKKEFQITVNQNQPKMLVINKELVVAINAKIENAQVRKVSFHTENYKPFYLETSMERTEFLELYPMIREEELNPDEIMEQAKKENSSTDSGNAADDDFMKDLGL